MGRVINLARAVAGVPATLIANFRFLPWRQALHLPILCASNVRVRGGGRVVIDAPLRFGMIRLGFGDVGTVAAAPTLFQVLRGGEIRFAGRCYISYACRVAVRGLLQIGADTVVQPRTVIIAWRHVGIGSGCLFSWDCQLLDTDFHQLRDAASGAVVNGGAPIIIGDRVWLGSRVQVLKNSTLADGCVVGAGAIVTSRFNVPGTLIAGVPAKVIRQGIAWSP